MESNIIQIWPKPDLKALDAIAKGQAAYYRQFNLNTKGKEKESSHDKEQAK